MAGKGRLIGRIDVAVKAMNELFETLLDVSRLDASALEANSAISDQASTTSG